MVIVWTYWIRVGSFPIKMFNLQWLLFTQATHAGNFNWPSIRSANVRAKTTSQKYSTTICISSAKRFAIKLREFIAVDCKWQFAISAILYGAVLFKRWEYVTSYMHRENNNLAWTGRKYEIFRGYATFTRDLRLYVLAIVYKDPRWLIGAEVEHGKFQVSTCTNLSLFIT